MSQAAPDEVLIVDGASSDDTAARGRFILTMDGDGAHPCEALWSRRGRAGLVVASRYMPGGSAVIPPRARRPTSSSLTARGAH